MTDGFQILSEAFSGAEGVASAVAAQRWRVVPSGRPGNDYD